MRLRAALCALAVLFVPVMAAAQGLPGNPAGFWRCVMNSGIVSINLQLQINPDRSLMHQGSIVYINTGRISDVRGPGRWLLAPPDTGSSVSLFQFQMLPADGNHASFSIFASPTNDPNFLASTFQNPQNGSVAQTNCQRFN